MAWDGLRTLLPFDIGPGFAGVLSMKVALPIRTGTYSVRPDLIREGKAWFSSAGSPPSGFPLRVTADLDADYGTTTAPSSIVPGSAVNIRVQVHTAGLKGWRAGCARPM